MPSPPRSTQLPGSDPTVLLNACRDLFLRQLRDVLGRAGVRDPAAVAACVQEVGEAHDELVNATPLDGFSQITGITASRLTLLGDDDLELDIRLRALGHQLREIGGRELWRCQARYMALLERPTMNEADHPLGPDVICLGLRALCKQYGDNHELQLTLLQRIEHIFRQELAQTYREIDALLAASGVELATGQTMIGTARRPADAGPGANPLGALQQAVSERRQAQPPSRSDTGVDFLLEADDSDHQPVRDAAARVMLQQILDRLSAFEALALGAGANAANGADVPLKALKAKDLDLPLGLPEAVTLDTLAFIFEAIFDASELPDAIKAAIARLQIPLVKLAMVDPTLFTNPRHPARQLINRISRAAVGLPRGTGLEHPVCRRISVISAAIRDDLAHRDADLTPYLDELALLIDERDRSVRQTAEAHVALVIEHENRLYAEHLARNWLRASLSRTSVPEVTSFLENYWFRVMAAAAIDGGCEGARWRECSATSDDLIWSVLPKQTADDRKRLAGLASSLVRRIAAGLDSVDVPEEERRPFLNALFDLQTAALRNQPLAAPAATSSRPTPGASTKTGAQCLTRAGVHVQYLVPQPTGGQQRRQTATSWRVGEWLRFCSEAPDPVCGMCCWQSPAATSALFFNPAWEQSMVLPSLVIDQQLSANRAQVVSRIAVFDAAAEHALGRLAQR